VVVDTLSPYVNPASLEVGASSSPYTYSLSVKGVLTFTFDPIYLPDSSHGYDSSSGYVMYSIHTRSNNLVGTKIKNTAYIYFDLNSAVVTNTTSNTVTLANNIRDINAGGMSIQVSPNPVHDKSIFTIANAQGEVTLELTDIAGKKVFQVNTLSNNISFESSPVAAGMYIYTARDTQGNTCTGKIVVSH
jgi:hypothetical protein